MNPAVVSLKGYADVNRELLTAVSPVPHSTGIVFHQNISLVSFYLHTSQ